MFSFSLNLVLVIPFCYYYYYYYYCYYATDLWPVPCTMYRPVSTWQWRVVRVLPCVVCQCRVAVTWRILQCVTSECQVSQLCHSHSADSRSSLGQRRSWWHNFATCWAAVSRSWSPRAVHPPAAGLYSMTHITVTVNWSITRHCEPLEMYSVEQRICPTAAHTR